MAEVSSWFNNLPTMTRHWFGGTVAFSLLGRFGILKPHWLILHYEHLFNSFQVCLVTTEYFIVENIN